VLASNVLVMQYMQEKGFSVLKMLMIEYTAISLLSLLLYVKHARWSHYYGGWYYDAWAWELVYLVPSVLFLFLAPIAMVRLARYFAARMLDLRSSSGDGLDEPSQEFIQKLNKASTTFLWIIGIVHFLISVFVTRAMLHSIKNREDGARFFDLFFGPELVFGVVGIISLFYLLAMTCATFKLKPRVETELSEMRVSLLREDDRTDPLSAERATLRTRAQRDPPHLQVV